MNTHKNASMTPKGRAHLVREIDRIGLKPAGLSTRTAAKWRRRFILHGVAGLADRSSRPHKSPGRSCPGKIERAVALRRNQRLTYDCIAERVGLSRSAVARACKRAGLANLPALQDAVPVRRYERQTPGELLHMDTKKLGRFDKPGHRVTGDRTQNTPPRAGWQALHVAIDDHSRVGFSTFALDPTRRAPMARPNASSNIAARVGLCLHLSQFARPRQRARTMDVPLQLPPPSLSYFSIALQLLASALMGTTS